MTTYRDPVGDLFAALVAADSLARAEKKRRREEARNTPEARAIRADAARRGWVSRRAREEAEAAQRAREYAEEWDRVPTGPVCGELYHDSVGHERTCTLEPDHDDEFCGEGW